MRVKQNNITKFVATFGVIAALFFLLLASPSSYAAQAVVYKEARPKHKLKKVLKDEVVPKQIPAKARIKPETIKPIKDKEIPKQDPAKAEKEKKYFYNPHGKIDPFAPFIIKDQESLKDYRFDASSGTKSKQLAQMENLLRKLRDPKTELQRIHISKLTLTAVIRGKSKNWAMVSDLKGRGYRLEKGTYIGKNGGVVDTIISEEKDTAFGKQSIRKVTIKEPFINRDQKIDYRFIDIEMPNRISAYK